MPRSATGKAPFSAEPQVRPWKCGYIDGAIMYDSTRDSGSAGISRVLSYMIAP